MKIYSIYGILSLGMSTTEYFPILFQYLLEGTINGLMESEIGNLKQELEHKEELEDNMKDLEHPPTPRWTSRGPSWKT